MKNFLITSCLVLLFSCSSDDDEPACTVSETTISMTINGVPQTFIEQGRGIDLRNDGKYTLFVSFSRYEQPSNLRQTFNFYLTYRERGQNVLDSIRFLQTMNGESLEGVFYQNELTNNVTVNGQKCFEATFNGTFEIEDEEFVITDGVVKYIYRDPFDDEIKIG